jgi:hypothetical protein
MMPPDDVEVRNEERTAGCDALAGSTSVNP